MANGDFFGAAGAGDSSWAVAGGGGGVSGTGALFCAVAGFCCIACWPDGGGGEAFGGPPPAGNFQKRIDMGETAWVPPGEFQPKGDQP